MYLSIVLPKTGWVRQADHTGWIFAEGVLYAEKDFNLAKHPEIDVPNLQVIKLMQSFKSKELVTERFAWRHYYWYGLSDCPDFAHVSNSESRGHVHKSSCDPCVRSCVCNLRLNGFHGLFRPACMKPLHRW